MNDTGFYLKKVMLRMTRNRNMALKKDNLTGPQMDIMEYISEHDAEECTVCHIAQSFDVKHTSVIHVLKLLEEKELIGRKQSEGGAHSRTIYLTEKAEKIMTAKREAIKRVDGQMLEGFSQEEKERLGEYLKRLYVNLEHICVENEEGN